MKNRFPNGKFEQGIPKNGSIKTFKHPKGNTITNTNLKRNTTENRQFGKWIKHKDTKKTKQKGKGGTGTMANQTLLKGHT